VQYKGIEKWNGVLPQVSGGALPLIDLGKMVACRAERKGAKDKLRVRNPNDPEKGNTMIKAGDMFKSIENGIIFRVKSVDPRTILLGTKDGTHSMLSIQTAWNPYSYLSSRTRSRKSSKNKPH